MTKMTYVQAIENAVAGNLTAETVERLNALHDSLVKRAEKAKTAERKPSKAVRENAEFKEQILAWMKEFVKIPMTSAEIAEGMGLDVRKVRGLLARIDGVEAVRINSKVTKWQVKA